METSLVHALALGAVQGLTEFLPISSSGHLILVPWLLGWPAHSLTFDVALHLGTLVALVVYFWRDWLYFARALLAGLVSAEARAGRPWALAWMLAFGCVPAALAGALFEDVIEQRVRQPALVAILLVAFGLLLYLADRLNARSRKLDDVTLRDAILIGCAQALALLPGVSRSGVTMTAALGLGLERAAAARFSFLLSAPIIFGAAAYKLRALVQAPPAGAEMVAFGAGIVAAAVVGALAIGFLLRYLQRSSTAVFVVYRVAMGLGVIALAAR